MAGVWVVYCVLVGIGLAFHVLKVSIQYVHNTHILFPNTSILPLLKVYVCKPHVIPRLTQGSTSGRDLGPAMLRFFQGKTCKQQPGNGPPPDGPPTHTEAFNGSTENFNRVAMREATSMVPAEAQF